MKSGAFALPRSIVTVGAQLRRGLHHDEFCLLVTMRGVASEAVGGVLGMNRLRFNLVANTAALANGVRGRAFETEQ